MSSCFSRCLRVPIAIRAFYESYLWILQTLLLTHPDLHPGLLGFPECSSVAPVVKPFSTHHRLFRPERGRRLAQNLLSHLFADGQRLKFRKILPDVGNAGARPVGAKQRLVRDLIEPRKI